MNKEEIQFWEKAIKILKEAYITKCEKPEDRTAGCIECRACETVEFIQEHIELLKDD